MYGFVRKSEFYDKIGDMYENDFTNYDKYKSKIVTLIENGNVNYLCKELIWQRNTVLSMIHTSKYGYPVPLLYNTGEKSDKMFSLFFGAVKHFSENIINNGDDSKDKYSLMKKYINFNDCKFITYITKFWGIETTKMKAYSNKYNLIEMIMKYDKFNGIKEEQIIYQCCQYDCFEYLKLILKYSSKNITAIVNGINFFDSPLVELVNSNHCSLDWLNVLLFETYNQIVMKHGDSRGVIEKESLKEAYLICQSKKEKQWSQMILDYATKTNQSLDV